MAQRRSKFVWRRGRSVLKLPSLPEPVRVDCFSWGVKIVYVSGKLNGYFSSDAVKTGLSTFGLSGMYVAKEEWR